MANDRDTTEPLTCSLCGKYEDGIYGILDPHDIGALMMAERLCFSCAFWTEHAQAAADPASVRVNGEHYRICTEKGVPGDFGFRGFGGAKFIVAFTDGRRVTSTNMWFQGVIPAHFRDRLPDNATFEREPRHIPDRGFLCEPEPADEVKP